MDLPLIGIKNLFVEFNEEEKVFVLYILMEKGECDLEGMIRKRRSKEMQFADFF